MNLLIYSTNYPSRLAYLCQQVFTNWLGLNVEWTNSRVDYLNYHGIKINYSRSILVKDDFLIPKCTFLIETTLKTHSFFPIVYNKIPALFASKVPKATFPFDLLATLFFHLSRYEEYLPFQSDVHDRFPASESWAYQNSCLQKPVVDLLVAFLKEKLKQQYPNIVFKPQKFQFSPTYDIDMAWAFCHKGWKRAIGGYLQDVRKGRFTFLKNRLKTHFLLQKDPFQKFDFLAALSRKFELSPIYFFLLGDYGLYDKNNSINTKQFRQLIQNIALENRIGIHPSYQSTNNQQIIEKEKQRLANITRKEIHHSRQHYLKLHLPRTYQQLIQAGITVDYSMGYASEIGFRAGTSLPFYWYDLEKEMRTDLLIQPFSVMEVTLKEYLKLSPEEAKIVIQDLIKTIKSVNGVFCSLWHNSSFSELEGWNEWEGVYFDLLEGTCL